ncbi:leucyl aminopeptidase [Nocardioides sp.]|uniref:leucyl aminopeptidase n=1 Tax=Nocardioides sp. TaxID=35761 RepID=UPI0035280DED
MTSYLLRSASPAKTRADAVVVGVVQTGKGVALAPGGEDVAEAYGRALRPTLAGLGVKGGVGEVTRLPGARTLPAGLVVLVGLGKEPTPDVCRRAAGVAARAVTNAASVALALPADTPELVRAVTEGWLLGGYTFDRFKHDTASEADPPGTVSVLSSIARQQEAVTVFEEAQALAAAVSGTRDWVNTPPGDLRPPAFAEAVADLHRAATKGRGGPRVTLTVHDEQALAELGCGGILGVGGASSAPPRLVEIGYRPKEARAHLALVGKGVTFDSGGLTIKPAQGMQTMKSDMAGAAAVVQATYAIAALGLPLRVSTFVPMAENMLGDRAMRPGDVLTIYGGRTVEVTNTDAEGRLILADALVRAVEAKPDVLLDVATLTGHMVVALGDRVAGVLGSEEVVTAVLEAGRATGEQLWPMPIPEDMDERVHASKVADLLQHDWVRWGGGLFAAAFLREFTGGLPWAHLDIAGPAFNSGGPYGHVTPGGTGFAVTTLVDYARSLC